MGLADKKSLYDLRKRGTLGNTVDQDSEPHSDKMWYREADMGDPTESPFNESSVPSAGDPEDHMRALLEGTIKSRRLGDGYTPDPANMSYLERLPVGVDDSDLEGKSLYPNYDNNFGIAGSTYKDAKQADDPDARF